MLSNSQLFISVVTSKTNLLSVVLQRQHRSFNSLKLRVSFGSSGNDWFLVPLRITHAQPPDWASPYMLQSPTLLAGDHVVDALAAVVDV